jgi:DNA-binding SARP family transcriptional activator
MDKIGKEGVHPMRIHLLGGFCILIDGETIPLDRFRLRKARNLVKLLALAPSHRLHREQLMEQLWPDNIPELAANNLNQALFAARRALLLSRT